MDESDPLVFEMFNRTWKAWYVLNESSTKQFIRVSTRHVGTDGTRTTRDMRRWALEYAKKHLPKGVENGTTNRVC